MFQRKNNVSDCELIHAKFRKVGLQGKVLSFITDDTQYCVEYESLHVLIDHYPAPQPYFRVGFN